MLQGIRVIELGTTITAPLAAVLLADMGADVIKVERPEGDPFRTFRGSGSPFFEAFNRGKRSVVFDLVRPDEQVRMRALLETADVFIDNVRPAVLPRLGLDPLGLQTANPRLIHCSITGFGAAGPYRGRPAFDTVAQALGGMSSLSLDPDEPIITGPTVSDNATGMFACIAVLGALARRSATGEGGRLEVNMVESTMAFIGEHFTAAMQAGIIPDRLTRGAGSQSYAFRCADGGLVAIHLSSLEKFWHAILAVIEAPELASDQRFATRVGRVDNYSQLRAELASRFLREDRPAWIERLAAADVPFAPVNSLLEVLDDPQIRSLGTVVRGSAENGEPLAGIASPIVLNGKRTTSLRRAPRLGEHTAEVCEA
jgi:crotonobetainyl-CoA:carnitine CoA-transferase CaiB-like acyl-CoA transferase